MAVQIALLRGINVGKAKRVPMAELRALLASLGFLRAHTLLNSGNAAFEAGRSRTGGNARRIENALEARFGFPVATQVLTATELDDVVSGNPLAGQAAGDPSRLLVAFLGDGVDRAGLEAIDPRAYAPEAFALSRRAAYLWCPNGILESALAGGLLKPGVGNVTTRNWATVLKLQALATSIR